MTIESGRRLSRTTRPSTVGNSHHVPTSPMKVSDVLSSIDRRLARDGDGFRVIPTGFSPLDESIGGGLQGGGLFLLAGGQGTGKTTMALQMARNIARSDGATCLYLSFEHDEVNLLSRLMAMESVQPETPGDQGLTLREVQRLFSAASRKGLDTAAALAEADPRLGEVMKRLEGYQDRLLLLRSSSRTMTVGRIGDLVDRFQEKLTKPVVLFVDYLQKVPSEREFLDEDDRIARVTELLNELTLQRRLSIVAIAALDQEGLRSKRLHVHHLWGGSALAYEADIIVMLTEKANAIAKINYEFSPQKVGAFREWVVASLEKNRAGQNMIDLEFRKRFASSCFDPNGGYVSEKLVDDRTDQRVP